MGFLMVEYSCYTDELFYGVCFELRSLKYRLRITLFDYTMSAIITLRIDEKVKHKIKQYKIPVSQIARAAILQEIEHRERKETLENLKKMKEILNKVDIERVVKDIREDRTGH